MEVIDLWVRFAMNSLSNPKKFKSSMQELNATLNSSKFLVRDKLTYADIAVWAELKSIFYFIVLEFDNALNVFTLPESNDWQKLLRNNETTFNNVCWWYESLAGIPQFQLRF